jgi:hypothetical protein
MKESSRLYTKEIRDGRGDQSDQSSIVSLISTGASPIPD